MRFSIASVALFAGAAVAMQGYEQQNGYEPQGYESTVYTTKEVTITSCGPEVTNCPGTQAPTDVPVPTTNPGEPVPVPSSSSTTYVTVTDCPPGTPNCPGSSTEGVPVPTEEPSAPSESTGLPTETVLPTEQPSAPSGTGNLPIPPSGTGAPSNPGGIPTVIPPYPTNIPSQPLPSTSVITYTTCIPTTMTSVITLEPTPTAVPTGGVPGTGAPGIPSGTGVMPTGTGVFPTTALPTYTGAASTFSSSYAVAGLAGLAAIFLA